MSWRPRARLGGHPAVLRCMKWFGITVVVIVGAVGGIAYDLSRPPKTGPSVQLEVKSGETARQVAASLQQAGLIRSALLFRLVLTRSGQGSDIKAGDYRLRAGMSMKQIAAELTSGQASRADILVTIPEGFTTAQIASTLQAHQICRASDFLRVAQTAPLSQTFVTKALNQSKGTKMRLEGVLFPDTYAFYAGEPPVDVLNEMLDNFWRHVGPLQTTWTKQGKTLPEIITVASMIEREAKVDSERPLIASVIYNRLRLDMPLQIDATVAYMLGQDRPPTERDLERPGVFNTYLHTGLPPGPIANPGMASILAALHPKPSPYLYYVVKNNGSGEDYFAKTYAAQLRNIARSQANLRQYQAAHS